MNIKGILKGISDSWSEIAVCLADFNARLVLTVVYFIIVLPLALLVNPFMDPLRIKIGPEASTWRARGERSDNLEKAGHQY